MVDAGAGGSGAECDAVGGEAEGAPGGGVEHVPIDYHGAWRGEQAERSRVAPRVEHMCECSGVSTLGDAHLASCDSSLSGYIFGL